MFSIKKLFLHIVYLNIIVALSSAVLSAGFCFYLQMPNWIMYGGLAFFSTFAVYNGQRLFKSRNRHKTPWLVWVDQNKYLLYTLVIAALAIAVGFVIWLGFHTNEALVLLSFSGLVSMFYVIPLGRRNLRELPHLKIHLIAISWSLVLIVFPMVNSGMIENSLWFGLAHYFYVLGVAIPFDIRDLKYDDRSQKTIPQVLGINAARILALFCLLAFSIIMLYVAEEFWNNILFFSALAIQAVLIIFVNEQRSDMYTAGMIDGAIGILGASYLL